MENTIKLYRYSRSMSRLTYDLFAYTEGNRAYYADGSWDYLTVGEHPKWCERQEAIKWRLEDYDEQIAEVEENVKRMKASKEAFKQSVQDETTDEFWGREESRENTRRAMAFFNHHAKKMGLE